MSNAALGMLASYPKQSVTRTRYTVDGEGTKTLASTVTSDRVFVVDVKMVSFQGRQVQSGSWVMEKEEPQPADEYMRVSDSRVRTVLGFTEFNHHGVKHYQVFLT